MHAVAWLQLVASKLEAGVLHGEVLNYLILDIVEWEMANGINAQPEVTIGMEELPAAIYFMDVKQGERSSVYK